MLKTQELTDLEKHLKFYYALRIDTYINRLYLISSRFIRFYDMPVEDLERICKDFEILEDNIHANES